MIYIPSLSFNILATDINLAEAAALSGISAEGNQYLDGRPPREQLLELGVQANAQLLSIVNEVNTIRNALELIDPYVVTMVSGTTTVSGLTASGIMPINPSERAVYIVKDLADVDQYVAADFYRDKAQYVSRNEVHNSLITNLNATFDLSGASISLKKGMGSTSTLPVTGFYYHFTNHAYYNSGTTAQYIPLNGSLSEAGAIGYERQLIAPCTGKIAELIVYSSDAGGSTVVGVYVNGSMGGAA